MCVCLFACGSSNNVRWVTGCCPLVVVIVAVAVAAPVVVVVVDVVVVLVLVLLAVAAVIDGMCFWCCWWWLHLVLLYRFGIQRWGKRYRQSDLSLLCRNSQTMKMLSPR